jgi:hypothetical protein
MVVGSTPLALQHRFQRGDGGSVRSFGFRGQYIKRPLVLRRMVAGDRELVTNLDQMKRKWERPLC